MIRAAHKICEQNIRNLQGVKLRFPSIDFPQSSVIKEVCCTINKYRINYIMNTKTFCYTKNVSEQIILFRVPGKCHIFIVSEVCNSNLEHFPIVLNFHTKKKAELGKCFNNFAHSMEAPLQLSSWAQHPLPCSIREKYVLVYLYKNIGQCSRQYSGAGAGSFLI